MNMTVDDRRWFILRVRAGMEDSIFEELAGKGYDTYLPRRRYDNQNRRMRVWVERNVPLLPGYVFIVHPRKDGSEQLARDDWREVVQSKDGKTGINGVLGPLKGHDGPLRVPARVIEIIMQEEFNSVYDTTAAGKRARGETNRSKMESRFAKGRIFRVEDGPFETFLAEIDHLSHDDRVVALVDIFGRMTPVEFEADQLKETEKRSKPKAA